ncbi:MAG: hypothetical protein WCI53_11495 [Bacteroidota bacterium]|jgi:hypothetical protein
MKKFRIKQVDTFYKNNWIIVFVYFVVFSFLFINTNGQENKPKNKFKVTGNLSLTQEFFGYSNNDTSFKSYRPNSATRFAGSTSLSYGKFSLPFSISYTLQSKSAEYNSPIPSTFRLSDLLNYYNQLSLSPSYKSFQGFIGTQVPKYSELTSGDLPIFGGGFEWKPKKFRIAAFYGIAQRAANKDSLLKVNGTFKRTSFGGKLGIGLEEGTHFYIIGIRHQDDVNSAIVNSIMVKPQDNTVLSIDQKLLIAKKFFIKTEVAFSAFSSDLNESKLELDTLKLNINPLLLKLYTPRLSSRYGAAGTGSIGYNGTNWSLKFVNRIYSPEYKTLNFPFLQTDRLEYTVEPAFSIFSGKFNFQGSYGQRIDNIFFNKIARATQKLLSININGRFTNNWSYTLSHSNFGIQNTITNDTFRLNNINDNYSFSSTYILQRKKAIHTLTGVWNMADFEDYNIVSGGKSNNETQTFMVLYSFGLIKIPLSLSLSGTHLKNKLFLGDLAMQIISLNETYTFGKKKNISLMLSQNYQMTSLFAYSPDRAINLGTGINYIIFKGFNLGLNGNMNILSYGSAKPGIQNMENTIRILSSYNF